jgi:hypothetical protein
MKLHHALTVLAAVAAITPTQKADERIEEFTHGREIRDLPIVGTQLTHAEGDFLERGQSFIHAFANRWTSISGTCADELTRFHHYRGHEACNQAQLCGCRVLFLFVLERDDRLKQECINVADSVVLGVRKDDGFHLSDDEDNLSSRTLSFCAELKNARGHETRIDGQGNADSYGNANRNGDRVHQINSLELEKFEWDHARFVLYASFNSKEACA